MWDKKGSGSPRPILTNLNVIAVIIGIVIGIGIFRLPPLVAQNAATGTQFLGFWVAGGLISMVGALCYAELAALKPDAGGEYFILRKAYGSPIGFLFSWGRMTVIQTGSIALAALILGDYASRLLDLGSYSTSIYAAASVMVLTGLNIWGTRPSKNTQNVITGAVVFILLSIGAASLFMSFGSAEASGEGVFSSSGTAGMAMIFVLLTYGGWNEAVYLSAELKDVRHNIMRVLISGLAVITIVYLLVNLAYLQILGMETLRSTDAIGVNLMERLVGANGGILISLVVVIAALSTTNATIITGARTNYAMGRDYPLLGKLGIWNQKHDSPRNALLVQGGIVLLLIVLGAITEDAVSTMVDYTAPVFWFFILLTTLSIFIFRRRYRLSTYPYQVPFYPVTPLLFAGACGYLLYSSLAFTGMGALIGIGILVLGTPLYLLDRRNGEK